MHRRRRGLSLVALVTTSLIGLISPGLAGAMDGPSHIGSIQSANDLSGVHVLGWEFEFPQGIAAYDNDVWIANRNGSTVNELNGKTGALIRVLSGDPYDFGFPSAVTTNGTDVWVAAINNNEYGDPPFTVTEFNVVTGAFVALLKSASYEFDMPAAIAACGADVWVGDESSVTEISATTRGVVRILKSSKYQIDSPAGITCDGTHVWIANDIGNTVTELRQSTGALIQVIKGDGFNSPQGIASDGTDVWITNNGGNTVTELNQSTGKLVRILHGAAYRFNQPAGVAVNGKDLFIADGYGHLMTEVSEATDHVVKVFSESEHAYADPASVVSDGSLLWVTNGVSNTASQVSATRGTLLREVSGVSDGLALGDLSENTPMTTDGSDVWVVNHEIGEAGDLNTVTELSETTGQFVRVISGSRYEFNTARGITSTGSRVWIANAGGNSVTEINAATGSLVGVIKGKTFGFNQPICVTSNDGDVWIGNAGSNSITELNDTTGALVRVISGTKYGLTPGSLSADGIDLWVANQGNEGTGGKDPPSVTEIDQATGGLVRVITGSQYDFLTSQDIASNGTDVFVSGEPGSGIAEISASTGAFVRLISDVALRAAYGDGAGLAVDGKDVLVDEEGGQSVLVFNASTGKQVLGLAGVSYPFDWPGTIAVGGGRVWVANPIDNSITEFPASL